MALDLCSFGALDPELIFRSLLGHDASAKTVNLRVIITNNVTELTPIHCGNMEDFMLNLRRALVLAADGQIALRVNLGTYADGRGLTEETCGMAGTWADYANSLFCQAANGNVYLNIANVD